MSRSDSHDAGSDPPEPGDRPKARPRKKSSSGSSPATRGSAAELQSRLDHAERRLRELTDQCLGFLAELASARRWAGQADLLRQRVEALDQLVADASRKARSAGAEVLRAAPPAAAGGSLQGRIDVVVWGGVPTADRLRILVERLAGAAVTCLVPVDAPAAPEGIEGVQWYRTGAATGTPAWYWNTGVGVTRAPSILFLHADAEPCNGGWSHLPLDDDTVALLQPLVRREGGAELGRTGSPDFEPEPRPAGPQPVAEPIPDADPVAFVLRREFVERIGPFDEDLVSSLALTEYVQRIADLGGRVVAWPTAAVELTAEVDLRQVADRDRMLAIARHRPDRLGSVWARAEFLWHLDPAERGALFDALVSRLPDSDRWPEGVRTMRAVAESMVRETLSPRTFADRFEALLRAKLEGLEELRGDCDLPLDRLAGEVRAEDVFERLQVFAEVEHQARRILAGRARESTAELTRCRDALAATERRVAELESEHAAHRAETEASEREVEALRRSLSSIAGAIHVFDEPGPGRIRERLLAMQADVGRLGGLLSGTDLPDVAALIQTLHDVRQQLVERERWIVALLKQSTRRRLSPFGVKLQPHEEDFIRRVDGKPPS